eukprot:m.1637690 g.1637690  ORF g.1637690 m.1637690 type:complete len:83 (+) comp26015_c0_seq1:229-477(+)
MFEDVAAEPPQMTRKPPLHPSPVPEATVTSVPVHPALAKDLIVHDDPESLESHVILTAPSSSSSVVQAPLWTVRDCTVSPVH